MSSYYLLVAMTTDDSRHTRRTSPGNQRTAEGIGITRSDNSIFHLKPESIIIVYTINNKTL